MFLLDFSEVGLKDLMPFTNSSFNYEHVENFWHNKSFNFGIFFMIVVGMNILEVRVYIVGPMYIYEYKKGKSVVII